LPIRPRTQCTPKKCPFTPPPGSHRVHLTIDGFVHQTEVEQISRISRTSTSGTLPAEHYRKNRHFGGPARSQRDSPPRFQLAPSLIATLRHLRPLTHAGDIASSHPDVGKQSKGGDHLLLFTQVVIKSVIESHERGRELQHLGSRELHFRRGSAQYLHGVIFFLV
jgi:hypothetical protein